MLSPSIVSRRPWAIRRLRPNQKRVGLLVSREPNRAELCSKVYPYLLALLRYEKRCLHRSSRRVMMPVECGQAVRPVSGEARRERATIRNVGLVPRGVEVSP